VLAKRFGDVPPLITILGVLIGIPFFGLMGLVLGPLILIYFLILVDIYVKNSKHLKPTSER
jgi:predicted PurR-regulated permease PerM